MIEKLLAALAEGAEDGAAPRTAVGAEEIADILWLAARVDPAAVRTGPPAPGAADTGPEPSPPPSPPAPPPGAAPDPGPGAAQLFPATTGRSPSADRADDGGGRRGTPLRLPRTASLDDPLGLMRSLRPVGRRSIGGPGEELDEQLTVERSIEAMVPTPVLRPAESRWLDLALVVDAHPSMLLWADLVAELRGVLTRSGVFRDVRTWQLAGTGRGGTPQLVRGPAAPPRNPQELADPAGRRLILVVSDTVAAGWQEGPLRAVLRHWSGHNAVAVLNVLPERLWTRGAVRPVPFAVRCERPAAATRSWQRVPAARRARGGGPVVPVVGLASGSLARLVRVVSGDGRWRRLACLRLDAAAAPPATAPPRSADPLELVERFRAGASPTAQQLAAHLAAVPLTLPVMTLVRRSLLRGSEHGHLAEVALGGLFAPWEGRQHPDEAEFEFLPGVREALLGSQLRGDVAAVRELVRRRVWEFMSRNRGTGPDFSATRVTTGEEGRRPVPEGALPFAERGPGEAAAGEERGPGDRVVRVRFEPLAEPKEVGTLLAPRLVLTVGHVPRPGETVAWVRSGGREVPCRPVWWDEATPRVLLVESGEDLADPAECALQAWGALAAGAGTRVRVDGVTEMGRHTALTGTLAWDGAPNAEIVRLSAEPEDWTHFVGGPVSSGGRLLGVVHTVRPDRLVFLSGAALLEQPAFRAALDRRTGDDPPRGDAGHTQVTLSVRVGQGAVPRGSSAGAEIRNLLMRLMADSAVPGTLIGGEGSRTLHLLLDPPGALEQAGRLLAALPEALVRYGDARAEGLRPPLALVLGLKASGHPVGGPEPLIEHDLVLERLREAGPGHTSRLLLVLSRRLYEELDELVGPAALRALVPLGGEARGWVCSDHPVRLAELLAEAEQAVGHEAGWPRCRAGASEPESQGCPGIRSPGRHGCLAHLPPGEQQAVLGTLGPGSSVDFRGTPFAPGLLGRVLDAVRDPGTGRVTWGAVTFAGARFEDGWEDADAVFLGDADFSRVRFSGPAGFSGARFNGETSFAGAEFTEPAVFGGSRFQGPADFRRAVFARTSEFTRARCMADVSFEYATLVDTAALDGMTVEGRGDFRRVASAGGMVLDGSAFAGPVSFAHTEWTGPLSARGTRFVEAANFDHTVFDRPTVFQDTRFGGPATFASASFQGGVSFLGGVFEDSAAFEQAVFGGPVRFEGTSLRGGASFAHASFAGRLRWRDTGVENRGSSFQGAWFQGSVHFVRAEFAADTGFDGATFEGGVSFESSAFGAALTFDGTAFRDRVEFSGVKVARRLSLPADWTATRSDDGLWDITSPHPAGPRNGASPGGG
ncbi:SAV_2336 N-terminal domain-related protein [Streptomyces sp. NPDC001389]|uniref:SAV_2336 N-terminal domain-related protein n=1 Tax=unclassified Streptomyces TaxID=2593676 RepID=UPI003695123B